MLEFIIQVAATTSFFIVIEHFFTDQQKGVIADFFLCPHVGRFQKFEAHTIDGILQLFMHNGRIALPRVLIYSIFSIVALLIWILGAGELFLEEGPQVKKSLNEIGLDQPLMSWSMAINWMINFVILPLVISIFLQLPVDYLSLNISKRLFYKKTQTKIQLIRSIFADVFMSSVLPTLMLLGIVFTFYDFRVVNENGVTRVTAFLFIPSPLIVTALITSILGIYSALLISFIQVALLLFGTIVSAFSRLSSLGVFLEKYTNIREHPIAFLGFLIAICMSLSPTPF